MLLLLLSRFSRVQFCAIPEMAAHQAPLSLGFSRQECWSGLPFPFPVHESESEVAQSCLTFSNPMDCSLPGFSIHGILQARTLEWVAISFSNITCYIDQFLHFHMLTQPFIPWINLTWSLCILIFICCWIWFASVLLSIFVFILRKSTGLWLFKKI